MSTLDAARARVLGWRSDPVSYVRDQFGVEPDRWQVKALASLKPGRVNRLCMRACAGPGKSAVLAWAGWWFLSCFAGKGEHPKGAAVSITSDNLRDNLWAEMSKWRERSPFLKAAFTWQAERIFANDHPSTWFLAARSFSKTADATEQGRTLSGLHSQFPFILLDETGDMSTAIGRAAEQAMGGCNTGMIAMAGNPSSREGLLYHSAVSDRASWDVVEISADPDDPDRTPRVDIEWARKEIATNGRDNPWVMAFILGKFPPSSLNALLGPDEVLAAMKKHHPITAYDWAAKVIGVDVARFGGDRTVLFPRQGLVAFRPEIMRGARTNEIGARGAIAWNNWQADAIMVDGSGGYGAGVVDSLLQHGLAPMEIQFAGKADDSRYHNKRSEMWFRMAEWVKRGGALPNIPELVRELTAPTYAFHQGRLLLEQKDQIKARLGFSPDLADALCLTFAVEVLPRPRTAEGVLVEHKAQAVGDYDPYADG